MSSSADSKLEVDETVCVVGLSVSGGLVLGLISLYIGWLEEFPWSPPRGNGSNDPWEVRVR